MAGVDDLVVYMQTAVKYSSLYIHHPSHFPIFSRPQPGGGVYLWGPKIVLTLSDGFFDGEVSCQGGDGQALQCQRRTQRGNLATFQKYEDTSDSMHAYTHVHQYLGLPGTTALWNLLRIGLYTPNFYFQ